MSARGDLVTLYPPLEPVRAALIGEYSVMSSGATGLEVRDTLDKLVCRVRVLVAAGDSFWLTLDPLRGFSEDGERIRQRLLRPGFLTEDAWKDPQVPMDPKERSDVAVARVLRRLLEIQDANLPGTLADTDEEFLHDYRVAIRRTRSVLREMRSVFPPEELKQVRASFKWLQDQTSATRDLDVYLQDFEELGALAPSSRQADLAPLEPVLRQRHRRSRAAMEQALTSERARALRAEWIEILEGLVEQNEADRPDAARPISGLAGRRIRRVHHKMVKMGRTITPDSAPEDYHELRKKGKELRYLLELFAMQVFDPDVVKPMIKTLKGLQDVLGLHQDREVQIEMLQELGPELVSQPDGPRALMAVGTLVERLEAEAHRARGEFAGVFSDFSSRAQCRLVAHTFG